MTIFDQNDAAIGWVIGGGIVLIAVGIMYNSINKKINLKSY